MSQEKFRGFFGQGFFEWQYPYQEQFWKERHYDEDKYWGGFSREPLDMNTYRLPEWAIGGFEKHESGPVLAPSPEGWDSGRFGGGVHNGSILRKGELFYYIYRGERELSPPVLDSEGHLFNYTCDIGIATSPDGLHFTKDTANSPLFATGEDADYSFEDANVVKHEGSYYLFCNRWYWPEPMNPARCGCFLAVSNDLITWKKHGLVFPHATEIHRNPCVVQSPDNEAVRINGRFVMYLNNGIIAYSDDMLHWESEVTETLWPGGEGCFALANYNRNYPDHILLFTGGQHTGHFYAIGEVLFHKDHPGKPLEWLPRPVLYAETRIPWEDGYSAEAPHQPVSYWRDTIFFTGMTRHDGKWWLYYGGSEYYTCLATAAADG